LVAAIMKQLNGLNEDESVMLKLTLPEKDGLYADCVAHSNVARVVALSGGYSRLEANDRLSRQNGMVASFSRALSEGLSAQQSDDEFNATLDASIASIAAASAT
jgi:fructose-bisphosphate aldolase class I